MLTLHARKVRLTVLLEPQAIRSGSGLVGKAVAARHVHFSRDFGAVRTGFLCGLSWSRGSICFPDNFENRDDALRLLNELA